MEYSKITFRVKKGSDIMAFVNVGVVNEREPMPGYKGKFIHSKNMTFVYWDIQADRPLPEHSHAHEQVVNVIEGTFELTIDGKTEILEAGSVAIIPSNTMHTGRAITHCRILDVFYPIRQDYQFDD
jgi:quercetin dioxygenase-like cupin family protein